MPIRMLRPFLLLALVVGSAAAHAAEITLYEHANFAGAQLTLRGYTPNFANTGFNDRVSSIVVSSGRWELCTDADFKGTCTVFEPGEYPTIDRRLNDRYSSAREIGSNSERRGSYSDYGRGAIELFDGPDFSGRSLRLQGDAESLRRNGFDDRAVSVIVDEGAWQLCTEEQFGGECRSFSPGRYGDLGYGFANHVSSARLLRSPREAPVVIAPGHPPPAAPAATAVPRAFLYSARGLRGTSLAVAGPLGDLGRANFDDAAASLYVESGNWLACRGTWFRGDCRVFGPGRYDDLAAFDFDRAISSIRPGAEAPPPAPAVGLPVAPALAVPPADARRAAGLEFFSEPGFGGDRLLVDRDVGNLERLRFDRRAASVVVLNGTWELCTDLRFGGNCVVLRPGRYPRLGGLTRAVTSVRRID